MKIHEGRDAEGRLIYFEVPNVLLSRRAASRLVARVPGVSILSWPSYWPFGVDDVFCKFDLDGKHFELWEPFGDNSRFHIAATPLEPCTALHQLRETFQKYRPVSGVTRLLVVVAGVVLVWFRFFRY
jgi:hypothetical protein